VPKNCKSCYGKSKTKVPWHMKAALKDIKSAKKKRGY
jgi:hypothetical protein